MQGTVLACLTSCNTADCNFFVRLQAAPAKAISRIYAKSTAAPARGACRPIRMRTFKVSSRSGLTTEVTNCVGQRQWPICVPCNLQKWIRCPLLALSGHALLHCMSPLLTQSGHQATLALRLRASADAKLPRVIPLNGGDWLNSTGWVALALLILIGGWVIRGVSEQKWGRYSNA